MDAKEARVESACWDSIYAWCLRGAKAAIEQRDEKLGREVKFTVEFNTEEDPDLLEPIPTLCAFVGNDVVCGFNSDNRLQALVLCANWCQEEMAKEDRAKTND